MSTDFKIFYIEIINFCLLLLNIYILKYFKIK